MLLAILWRVRRVDRRIAAEQDGRLARGRVPEVFSAFAIATKNLNKNLGTELTTEQLLDVAKGGGQD